MFAELQFRSEYCYALIRTIPNNYNSVECTTVLVFLSCA